MTFMASFFKSACFILFTQETDPCSVIRMILLVIYRLLRGKRPRTYNGFSREFVMYVKLTRERSERVRFLKFSLRYQGPKVWNNINFSIKSSSLPVFKAKFIANALNLYLFKSKIQKYIIMYSLYISLNKHTLLYFVLCLVNVMCFV